MKSDLPKSTPFQFKIGTRFGGCFGFSTVKGHQYCGGLKYAGGRKFFYVCNMWFSPLLFTCKTLNNEGFWASLCQYKIALQQQQQKKYR